MISVSHGFIVHFFFVAANDNISEAKIFALHMSFYVSV